MTARPAFDDAAAIRFGPAPARPRRGQNPKPSLISQGVHWILGPGRTRTVKGSRPAERLFFVTEYFAQLVVVFRDQRNVVRIFDLLGRFELIFQFLDLRLLVLRL